MNTMDQTVDIFMKRLEKFLENVPNKPSSNSYIASYAMAIDNFIHKQCSEETWSEIVLQL